MPFTLSFSVSSGKTTVTLQIKYIVYHYILPLRDNLILHALESFLWYLMTSRLVCNSTSVLINGEDKIKERATLWWLKGLKPGFQRKMFCCCFSSEGADQHQMIRNKNVNYELNCFKMTVKQGCIKGDWDIRLKWDSITIHLQLHL